MNEKMIKEIKEESYNKGLEDAWELARKIANIPHEKRNAILGTNNSNNGVYDILSNFTTQEALAKFKAYEEQSKIEVGDVVVHGGDTVFVVTKIDKMIMGYDKIGCAHSFCFPNQFIKKTGKHIDITSILEQIRSE